MGIICYFTIIIFFVLDELKILNLGFFDIFIVPILIGILCGIIFGLPSTIERVSKQKGYEKNIENSKVLLDSLAKTAKDIEKKSIHEPNPYRYKDSTIKDEDDGG